MKIQVINYPFPRRSMNVYNWEKGWIEYFLDKNNQLMVNTENGLRHIGIAPVMKWGIGKIGRMDGRRNEVLLLAFSKSPYLTWLQHDKRDNLSVNAELVQTNINLNRENGYIKLNRENGYIYNSNNNIYYYVEGKLYQLPTEQNNNHQGTAPPSNPSPETNDENEENDYDFLVKRRGREREKKRSKRFKSLSRPGKEEEKKNPNDERDNECKDGVCGRWRSLAKWFVREGGRRVRRTKRKITKRTKRKRNKITKRKRNKITKRKRTKRRRTKRKRVKRKRNKRTKRRKR